jgi:hypothetical protein
MNTLSFRARALEGSYFKAETDQCILERAASLGMRARAGVEAEMARGVASAGVSRHVANDMLPEVLAHHLPVNKQRPLTGHKNALDYQIAQPQRNQSNGMYRQLTRKTYVDSMGGSTMNTGRGKWGAGNFAEANTSIWNVQDAQRLMLDGANNDPNREKRLRFVNPPKPIPVVMVAGKPIRFLPDPTPGRALFWGTVLCVWAGAATGKLLLRSLDVQTISELRPKVTPMVADFASNVNDRMAPVKDWQTTRAKENAMDMQFSRTLKMTISG